MSIFKSISRLHFITSGGTATGQHARLAELVCKGGCKWVQFRMKTGSEDEIEKEAKETQAVCRRYKAQFIVNDYVNLAERLQADGVHLGEHDTDLQKARKILGKSAVIGATANDESRLAALQSAPVDYIGLGPYRFTTTKDKLAPLLGNSIMDLAQKYPDIPVIAIGGIHVIDIPVLLSGGVHGVAVSGAISQAGDITAATKSFVEKINSIH